MKKLILASAMLAAFSANVARAEEAAAPAAEPVPDNVVAYNVGIASEYRYRGVSQSRFKPAYSAGVDYTNNPTGIYLGSWVSTIKWIQDGGATDGKYEWDFYGGKKGEIVPDVGYDVGGLYYWYPKNTYGDIPAGALYSTSNANTFELYGKINKGPYYLKYSHSLTDLFGWKDSHNSYYLDGGADLPLAEGLVLNLHVGHQKVTGLSAADFTDYKVGVTKDFGFVAASAAYIAADTDKAYYVSPNGTNLGKSTLVVSLTKAF
jgi:uncharacterized protein (TIGR02001 family)